MCCTPILAKVSYICIEKTCFIPLALTKILEIFRNGDVRGQLIDVCRGLADRQRGIVQSLQQSPGVAVIEIALDILCEESQYGSCLSARLR